MPVNAFGDMVDEEPGGAVNAFGDAVEEEPEAAMPEEYDPAYAGQFLQGVNRGVFADLPATVVGLPGSLGNAVLDLFGAEPQFVGVGDAQERFREGYGDVAEFLGSPVVEPRTEGERMASSAGSFVGQSAIPMAGQLSRAASVAPSMGTPLASALDDMLVAPFRKNPLAATGIEMSAAAGSGAASEGLPDLPVAPGTDLGDVIGEENAALAGSLLGSMAAPWAGGQAVNRLDRAGTRLINTGAEAIGREAPLATRAANQSQRDMAQVFLDNEEQVDNAFSQVDRLGDQMFDSGITSTREALKPTIGQILDNDELLTLEKDAIRTNRAPEIRQQQNENERLLDLLAKEKASPFDVPDASPTTFGQNVQDRLAPQVRAEREAIELPDRQARTQLKDVLEETTGDILPVDVAGKTAREGVLLPAEKEMSDQVGKAFDTARKAGLKKVPASPDRFRETVTQQAQEGAESLTPALTESGVAAAKKSMAKVSPEPEETGVLDAEGEMIMKQPSTDVSLDTMQSDISRLKRTMRTIRRSSDPGVDAKVFGEQLGALNKDFDASVDRALARETNPQVKTALQEGRKLRREQAILFEGENNIGKVLKQADANGNYRVAEAEVLPTLLTGNKGDVKTMLDILDRPQFGSQKVAVKKGVADLYRKTVLNAKGGVKVEAHRKFMDEYGPAVDRLWGPQAKNMRRIGPMQQQADLLAKSTKESLSKFNKLLKTRLAGESPVSSIFPEEVYGKITSGKPARRLPLVRGYKEITEKAQPDLWREFQSLRKDELLNSFRSASPKGSMARSDSPLLDPGKIDKTLNDPQAVEELDLIFGPEYRKSLEELNQGIKVFRRRFDTVREPAGVDIWSRAANFARIKFAPLTPEGRALTAVKKELQIAGDKSMAQMLEDPRYIREVARMLKEKDISDSAKNLKLLGQIGALEFLDPESTTNDATNAETENPQKP